MIYFANISILTFSILVTCPTTDPKYKSIGSQCFYFEENGLNFTDANVNCKEKLKGVGDGRLYEPKTIGEITKISTLAGDSIRGCSWIGITDITTEGKYVYNSDERPIEFTPTWFDSSKQVLWPGRL